MAWRYYRSTDAGAPVLNGIAGSILTVLDAVLTGPSGDGTGNAYGSKPCAGWSKQFTGTNKRVYRAAAGSTTRFSYRVLDDGSGGVGARDAAIRGFRTMTDIDTGTGPFPTTSDRANGLSLAKSTAINSNPVAWFIVASGQTFVMGVAVGRWQVAYVGEFDSFTPSDELNAVIIAAAAGSTPDGFSASRLAAINTLYFDGATDWENDAGVAFAGNAGQGASAVNGGIMQSSGVFMNPDFGSNGTEGWGALPRVNPADGSVHLGFVLLNEHGNPWSTRGKLRGVYPMPHKGSTWTDQETFDGAGDLAGKTFLVVDVTPYQTYIGTPYQVHCLLAVEISNTL